MAVRANRIERYHALWYRVPVWIITSGFDTYPDGFAKATLALAKIVPLARLGREAEVAGAIVFLFSPSAAYISGPCIRVMGPRQTRRITTLCPRVREISILTVFTARSVQSRLAIRRRI